MLHYALDNGLYYFDTAWAYDNTLGLTGDDSAYEDGHYNFTITATDPDEPYGEILDLAVNTTDISIIKGTDFGEWTLSYLPTQDDIGKLAFELTLSDNSGSEVKLNALLDVLNTNDPPVINSTAVTEIMSVRQQQNAIF